MRVVRQRDWDVSLEAMADAIDDDTALVAVSLVSNVNGRVEPLRALADRAHDKGALVYADIIQAAGIVPLDVRDLGIDLAAANGYKWLYGVHGAGFLYVRRALQGGAVPDRLFPGSLRFNYPPWVDPPTASQPEVRYRAPQDARRYQPGHVAYLAYAAVHEGLRFLHHVGVERALAHATRLLQRLVSQLDADRFACLTPTGHRTPMLSFRVADHDAVRQRLRERRITVGHGPGYVRVSPALYNDADDIDALVAALHAA